MRHTMFCARLAGLVLAAVLATASVTVAETVQLKADLKGTDAGATGTAAVTYDTASEQVTWRVTYAGLSGPPTMAHFHGPAEPGANAGVAVAMPNFGASPAQGSAADRRSGSGPAGGPLLHQHPYGRQSCRRDPRASRQVIRSLFLFAGTEWLRDPVRRYRRLTQHSLPGGLLGPTWTGLASAGSCQLCLAPSTCSITSSLRRAVWAAR